MNKILRFVTALAISVAATMAIELLFALIVKWLGLTSSVIRPVNVVIKAVCILLAVFLAVRKKGILCGGLIGVIYIFVTNLIFGLIGGGINFDISLLYDFLYGVAVGIIGGILSCNLKGQKN